MLTGDIRNQAGRIWDAFWFGGIANPLEIIEQITYLLILRRLDTLANEGMTLDIRIDEQGEMKVFQVSA